ncbi:hypothetical protein [Pararhizobium sp.]|uniref:hypothetical protein n=1 Tax=Pararhizobium sp. TaxID=1977563 RepID=UPI003D143EF0
MDYARVIEDFNNGTIDREKWKLVMDNDDGYWCYSGDPLDSRRLEIADMVRKYGKPGGYRDIVDVLNAAGVPCEWV